MDSVSLTVQGSLERDAGLLNSEHLNTPAG
jgi:hypothetical protein